MKAVTFPPGVPIWVDSERLSGAPCFEGTRVPVDSLFKNLESGLNLDEYLDCFPDVRREQAVAVLEYARQVALKADAQRTETRRESKRLTVTKAFAPA